MSPHPSVKQILKLFEDTGATAYEVSQATGITESGIGKILNGVSKNPRESTIQKILSYFEKDSNYSSEEKQNQAREPEDPNSLYPVLNSKKGVPYYDVDFVGGFDLVFNEQRMTPSFYISYAPYNNADAWVNVTGKSMSPFISHGDIAAFKKLNNWRDFFPLGEIYAIITSEHRTIKIVTAGKDENHLTLVPYNKSREFVEQQIHKDLILQMYKVMGSIKKFF